MRTLTRGLLALTLWMAAPAIALAQNGGATQDLQFSQSLTAPGTVIITTNGQATVTVVATGSGTGLTFAIQGTNDNGTTWTTLLGTVPSTGATATSFTANGTWIVSSSGFQTVRVNLTAISGGTETFALAASARAGRGSGGGSFASICPTASNGQILYDASGACGGITGWTTNGTTTITGGASTTLAIGGATIGSNALAVTGNVNFGTGSLTMSLGGIIIGQTQAYGLDLSNNRNGITIASGGVLSWVPSTNLGTTPDLIVVRDAANTLAQRNGVNAQTLRVYGTYTDASNGDWLSFTKVAGGAATIATVANGTGTASTLGLTASTVNVSNLLSVFNDVTTTGGSLIQSAAGSLTWAARSIIKSPSNGNISIQNAAGNDFGLFQFGGTTSSFPSIKRSTTALIFRLADDSADTAFTASTGTLSAIATDAAQTDNTVCVSSAGLLLKGSGTLGICLGTSSARFKNNIKPLEDGLAQIMQLQPVNYFYNKDHGDNGVREQYGLTAEDLIKVLPKLTHLDAEGKPMSVDLLGMVPVIIRAIQELKADNDNLRTEIQKRASR